MRLKKYGVLLCCFVLILFSACLVGCKSYSIKLKSAHYDFIDPVEYPIEYKDIMESTRYTDENVAKEVMLNLGDEVIKVYYKESSVLGHFVEHDYESANGDLYSLDSSGKLIYMHLKDITVTNDNEDAISESDGVAIARDFITMLYEERIDLSEYEVEVKIDNSLREYEIEYVKYIGGIETSDQASIVVNFDGKVVDFFTSHFGQITVDDTFFDISVIEPRIKEKVVAMVSAQNEKYDIEYGEIDSRIKLSSSQKPILECRVEVHFKEKGEIDASYYPVFHELIVFVVE